MLKTFQDSYVQLNPHLDRNNVHRSLEDMEQLDNEFRTDEKLAFARGVFDVERFEIFFLFVFGVCMRCRKHHFFIQCRRKLKILEVKLLPYGPPSLQ